MNGEKRMAKINWHHKKNEKAIALATEYGIHPLFTTILFNRGLREEEVIAVKIGRAHV